MAGLKCGPQHKRVHFETLKTYTQYPFRIIIVRLKTAFL